jgi:hypothetical protein
VRRAAGIALLAALAVAVTPARADDLTGSSGVVLVGSSADGGVVEELQMPVTATGQISVAFHGPGSTGLVVWRPAPSGQLFVARLHTRLTSTMIGILSLERPDGSGAQVRSQVMRTDAAGATHTCSDVLSPDYSDAFFQSRGTTARLGAGSSGLVALTTRCAGPLSREVTAALPAPSLTLSALRRGKRTLDFGAQRPFTAGALSGTVTSTLALHLGAARHQPTHTAVPKGVRVRQVRRREVTVGFAVERLTGTVPVDLAGATSDALCAPLDTCGLAGTLTVAPATAGGTGDLFADASATRTSRAVRAALGVAPGPPAPGLHPAGAVSFKGPRGTLSAQLERDGGGCSDTVALPAGGTIGLAISGGRLHATYLTENDIAADPLRTRCPGPTLADVAGTHALAAGSVSLGALRARDVTLHLTQGTGFAGAWSGRSRPDLTLVLRRTRVTERIVRRRRFG